MNIEDIKTNFIALLRDEYDAKQDRSRDYPLVFIQAMGDSDTDLVIGKKVLKELGFSGEVFRENVCPALVRNGVLESYPKYLVPEEEDMSDFPYQFRVNKEKLFEGSGRIYPNKSSIAYNEEDHILMVNETPIEIKGSVEHEVLSIVFHYFAKRIENEGVYFDEIAEKYDSMEDTRKGSDRVDNALRATNTKVRMHNFHNVFNLKDKKVKLDQS